MQITSTLTELITMFNKNSYNRAFFLLRKGVAEALQNRTFLIFFFKLTLHGKATNFINFTTRGINSSRQ